MTRDEWQVLEAILPIMSLSELRELRNMVNANIDAEEMRARRIELGLEEPEPEEQPAETGGDSNGAKRGKGGGYVELKYINGSGPYAYKRARVGGRLTSTYIGKIRQ